MTTDARRCLTLEELRIKSERLTVSFGTGYLYSPMRQWQDLAADAIALVERLLEQPHA